MDLAPSLNYSSWLKICCVSLLNFVWRTFSACWSFSFLRTITPGLSPKSVSIWWKMFLAGPLLCLKFMLILALEKWLKTKTLFFWSYSAITLVRIDLLYGIKSLVGFFLLNPFMADCFLNFFKMSIKVETLLSWVLASGTLMKEKEFKVL